MSIYICAVCDQYIDDDWNPGEMYGDELICQNCAESLLEEIDSFTEKEKIEHKIDRISDQEKLNWANKNL